jgi:hypothetical protein
MNSSAELSVLSNDEIVLCHDWCNSIVESGEMIVSWSKKLKFE